MNVHNFFTNLYNVEINKQLALKGALGVPSGIMTAIAGMMLYLCINFAPYKLEVLSIVFLVLAIVAGLCFIVTSVFLFVSHTKHYYRHIEQTVALLDHYRNLLQGTRGTGSLAEQVALSQYEQGVNKQLAQCTQTNAISNRERQADLTNAYRYLFRTLALIALSVIPYLLKTL